MINIFKIAVSRWRDTEIKKKRLTIWFVGVTVQHSVTRQLYPFLLQDAVHFSPGKNEIKY